MNERLRNYLSPENIPRVQKKIRRALAGYGHESRAEDCAQEYFVHLLEGKGGRQTIRQFVIDYLRKRIGNPRTAGFNQKRALEFAGNSESYGNASAMRFDIRTSLDDRLSIKRMVGSLEGRHREIAELYFVGGWRLLDIAEELNVSESRVSHLVHEIEKSLRVFARPPMSLTSAENLVANLLTKGMANKEIADKLCIAEKTVKFHLTNIYAKTGARTRSEFIVQYQGAVPESPKENVDMADWQPMQKTLPNVNNNNSLATTGPTGQEQVTFVLNAFKIDRTMDHLQTMSEEVTKGDYSVDKVMAACQCIGRMNETIQTVMKAAQVLKAGR